MVIKPFRLDRNTHGGVVIAFIREDILCKRLHTTNSNIEAISFEINLQKGKWLFCGGYNHNNINISCYVNALENSLDNFIKNYHNLVILGDFNAEADDSYMKTFCEIYKLNHVPTCFKNPNNPKSVHHTY